MNIKCIKFRLPKRVILAESNVEIEYDAYRSYHNEGRSSKSIKKNRTLYQNIKLQSLFMNYVLQVLVLLICCSSYSYSSNTYELKKNYVLKYYRNNNDTLGEKTASFLFDNMKYHYFFASEKLENYYENVKCISKKYKYPVCISEYKKNNDQFGNLSEGIKKIYDYEALSENEIINDIDAAIVEWKYGKWAQHLSFDQFCEYLLPYRIANEKLEFNRTLFKKLFFKYASETLKADDRSNSTFWAAKNLCDGIKKMNFHLNDKALPHTNIELPISCIYDMNMGACYQLAKLTCHIMKACGIPVSLDFTPQWGNRSGSHIWNCLLADNNKCIPFLGSDVYPGQQGRFGNRMPKVFRYTYVYQPNSAYVFGKKYNEPIPQVFNTPFIKDVTTLYQDGVNVTIHVDRQNFIRKHIVYLAVFDNQCWQPVDFAIIDNSGTAKFKNIGKGILYMPVFWTEHGSIPCGEPFFVRENGSLRHFVPDTSKTVSYALQRKYPLLGTSYDVAKKLLGGKIEASNNRNFKNATKVYSIDVVPHLWKNRCEFHLDSGYRYYRFVAPIGSKCEIAELTYMFKNQILQNYSKICDDSIRNFKKIKNVGDKNMLTYYESVHNRNAWIGADFRKAQNVDCITFTPRNDGNHIEKGHLYRLDFLCGGKLKPIKVVKAESDELYISGIPNNALLILHDVFEGTEERFFSINEDLTLTWY